VAFDDVQFPPVIARGARGGPAYSTSIVETTSGAEQRNANWSKSRGRWNVGTGLRHAADLAALVAFFHARRGRHRGFRFKDWTDYAGTGQLLGTGDGATTTFRLRRVYASGGQTVYRTVTRPVVGTATLHLNGVAQSSGVAVNYMTGLVTFTVAPGVGVAVTADFQFDVPARFDTDELDLELFHADLGQWPEVPVVELRE
jgi:uncharacterized protein (TIGR02217 family)